MLPWLGGGGFNFVDFLNYLESYGFFAYILPFLLVFAIVYAILSQLHIFKENKGANVIIAIAIGFLSLAGGFVPTFFQTIFPNFGVGLSIVLVGLLLAGAFISTEDSAYKWIFFALGGIIFLFVLFSSLSNWQFMGEGGWRYFWDRYAGLLIFFAILIGAIIAFTANKAKGAGKP